MNYSELPGKVIRSEDFKSSPYAGNDLLISAGFIRPSGQGFISYLPLGKRVLNNLIRIICDEMDNLGGMEISVPFISSEHLWEISDRNKTQSMEIARFSDRQGRSMILSPTHEEAVTHLLKDDIKSHKDLPLFVYQNQLKYREEIRPRGYLIRSREFMMHDGYSFHRNFTDLNNFFPRIFAAYERILGRSSIDFITSEADSGFMRGSRSYEFTLPHPRGKNHIISCPDCGYRANRTIARSEKETFSEPLKELCELSCEEVRESGIGPEHQVESKVYRADNRYIMAVYRRDFRMSVDKLKNLTGYAELHRTSDDEIRELGVNPKSISPFNLSSPMLIVVDDSVVETTNLTMHSGAEEFCFANVNFGRDFDAHKIGDIVRAEEGDSCRICGGTLKEISGIELGHIFKLDDYYTKKFDMNYQDEDGKVKRPFMGSYGIGLGRLLFAAADCNRDEKGLVWPYELAPYRYYLMGIGKSPTIKEQVYNLAEKLGNHVLVDDRREGIGVKLRDCDILGIPLRIIISNRYLEKGEVEVYDRKSGSLDYVQYTGLSRFLKQWENGQRKDQ